MKTIRFEGQTHQFPDDFSDSDISDALASAPPATVEQSAFNPPAEEAPVTAGGLYNAVDVGAAKAAAGMAGLPKVISDLGAQGIQAATNWTANKLGHPEWQDTRDLSKPGLIKLPTSEEAMTAIQRDMYGGAQPYQPQNRLERYGERVGEFLPNALAPGGLAARAASVLAPAVAGEATKEAGGGPLAQTVAELAGGIGVTKTQQALANRAAAKALPDLATAATKNYTDAANLGVTLAPTAVSKGVSSIQTDLATKFGAAKAGELDVSKLLASLETKNAPRAASPMAAMTGVAPAARPPVSIDEIKNLREQLGTITQGNNATERLAARMAQGKLDDFLANISKNDVITGDAQEAARLFQEARGNYAAMKRAEIVAGRIELGDLNAATAGSGANVDNATRQAVKALIRPDKYGKIPAVKMGFSPEEIAQMQLVARGSRTANTLRYAGNLLGGGGGLGQAVLGGAAGVAAYEGHPEYLPLVLAGKGAKTLSGKVSQNQANRLEQMVRSRSPAYQQITTPVQPLSIFQGAGLGASGILADPSQRQLLLGGGS